MEISENKSILHNSFAIMVEEKKRERQKKDFYE